jgi:hypothetical protein
MSVTKDEITYVAQGIHEWSRKNPSSPLTNEFREVLKMHRLAHAADPNDGITVRDANGNISVVSRSRARAEEVAE